MENIFKVTKSGDEYDLIINETRHFILPTIDEVLIRISETLLEEEDTKIPF